MGDHKYIKRTAQAETIIAILKNAAQEITADAEIDWEAVVDRQDFELTEEFLRKSAQETESAFEQWNVIPDAEREDMVEALLWCYALLEMYDRRKKVESVLQSL